MLGLSKSFVIVSLICIAIWFGAKDHKTALLIMVAFAGMRIVWKFLTD